MDRLHQFMEEECVVSHRVQVKYAEFCEAFGKWCDKNGMRSPGKPKIKADMERKGYQQVPGTNNVLWYHGIGLQNYVN